MRVDMTRWRSAFVTAALALGLGLPTVASAQMQFSLGGGWTTMPAPPSSQPYMRPFNLAASIALPDNGSIRWRADFVALDYRVGDNRNIINDPVLPCPLAGCPPPVRPHPFKGLTLGYMANAQIDLTPDERAYLLMGAGVYRLQLDGQPSSIHPGGTFGAGVNIPFSHTAEMFVEARWMGVNGTFTGPSWYLPVTVGFRSR